MLWTFLLHLSSFLLTCVINGNFFTAHHDERMKKQSAYDMERAQQKILTKGKVKYEKLWCT